ncbi:MAG: hypothetical protein K6F33_13355 [Bacteroidales bacterium]|nr:hypothetical protein [Bacteroidales bacterium]
MDANGCALITLSITHEKKRVFKPTGIRVKPNQFNESTQKVINHPQAAKMNAAINAAHCILPTTGG